MWHRYVRCKVGFAAANVTLDEAVSSIQHGWCLNITSRLVSYVLTVVSRNDQCNLQVLVRVPWQSSLINIIENLVYHLSKVIVIIFTLRWWALFVLLRCHVRIALQSHKSPPLSDSQTSTSIACNQPCLCPFWWYVPQSVTGAVKPLPAWIRNPYALALRSSRPILHISAPCYLFSPHALLFAKASDGRRALWFWIRRSYLYPPQFRPHPRLMIEKAGCARLRRSGVHISHGVLHMYIQWYIDIMRQLYISKWHVPFRF